MFICFSSANKGKKVSTQTISGWIKQAIIQAYKDVGVVVPSNVQGRSTRTVSASSAEAVGASMIEI